MQEHIDETTRAYEVTMLFELLERADALFELAHSPEGLDAMKDRIVQEVECRCYARRLAIMPIGNDVVESG